MNLQELQEPRRTPDVSHLFALAVDHHQSGRLGDAERLYRKVLERDTKHISCLYNFGLLSMQLGHLQAAIDLIGRAITLGGRVPEWHYNLAFALRAVGRISDAIAQYRSAIRLRPDYVEAIANLGNALKDSGRLKEAAECYTRVIDINPHSTEAQYNLANVLAEQCEWERAAVAYRRAIALKPSYAEAHNNLATVLGAQGKHAEAVAHYERALALNPNLVEAYVNIGKILAQDGKPEDALAHYQRALALKPDFVQAHNNMSVALLAKGDLDAAASACQRSLVLNPGLPEAHNNLGVVLLARGNAREAKPSFARALAARPDFFEAGNNLARAHLAEHDIAEALRVLSRTLTIRENQETKTLFVDCVKNVLDLPDSADIAPLVLRALGEPWGRQSDIARFSARLLTHSTELTAALERALKAWPNRRALDDLLRPTELKALAESALLVSLLDCGHVPDIALERFLTLLRSAILDVALASDGSDRFSADELKLFGALARLCFLNDYVFACTQAEAQEVKILSDRLSTAMRCDAPIPALWIIALAAYVPIRTIPGAASIGLRAWPQTVAALIELQVSNLEEEQRLQGSLPHLTPIKDQMSIKVREQYEENPYPRWAKAAPASSPATFDQYLRRLLPCAMFRPLGKQDDVDVLIAGCGTGQHPIEVAQRLSGARVLAVDLSLASLAYAQRQTRALGLDNIDYAQADIVELASLDRTFDIIESAGVLHHLSDPNAGSHVLASRLRPGGFLFLALYSQIARRDIAYTRDFIAARGYRATAEDIRRCRQDMMDAPVGTPLNNVTQTVDFYSTSECRDLLFHAQEQQTTLPEIKAYLAASGLRFLGFETDPWTRHHYARMFPDDTALDNLDHWHDFEQKHPFTFVRMYQFWAQKTH